ncbi:YgaP family membrane protein [Aquimarina algiphila]|uniref:DUF2892 domain-containing protein n=1 Tax=Aquimarina algiphila TaxID=2047982 RepID=A0A554VGK5_9FLAO|nr:DUF2892 domain-containing protein [Aquimarina algiphila]TSE06533.1 DUF2892 domain-containing protein [Aquimarina algiphila]
MRKNLGKIDAIIRIILGVVLAYLFYNNFISDTLGIVLLSVSGVLVITGFMGWCPLYKLFGITSCKVKN